MDKIDEYLLKEHGVIPGACSSIESVKYQIAREVYIKAIDKACKLLEEHYSDLFMDSRPPSLALPDYIEKFKQAMEE